jgi:serine/threonine protein kinase
MKDANDPRWEQFADLVERLDGLPADDQAQQLCRRADAGEDPELLDKVREFFHTRELTTWPWMSDVPTAALHKGLQVGDWTLEKYLGRGGMGEVWKANKLLVTSEDRQSILHGALKFIKPSPTGLDDSKRYKRFADEVDNALKVHEHQNICTVHGAAKHINPITGQSMPYFAMNYLKDAKSITRYSREHSLQMREWLDLFIQVCDAICHAHELDVVHLDLKPGNILVNYLCCPYVVDFGLAKIYSPSLQPVTAPSFVSGTPGYMSPEQQDPQRFGQPDKRSDQYALGVVLYELCSGKLPFPYAAPVSEQSFDQAMDAIAELGLREIFRKALAIRTEGRFPHVRAFRSEVKRFQESLTSMVSGMVSVSMVTNAMADNRVRGTMAHFDATQATALSAHDERIRDLINRSRSEADPAPTHSVGKTLYLVGGAFGPTKPALLEWFTSAGNRMQMGRVVKKLTCLKGTNAAAKYDPRISPDLILVEPATFAWVEKELGCDRFFTYDHESQRYGIPKVWIWDALKEVQSVLAICHVPIVQQYFDKHFPRCRRIKVWVYIDRTDLEEYFQAQCKGDAEKVEWRVGRATPTWDNFLRDPSGYRLVAYVGNDKGQKIINFDKQLETLFGCYKPRRGELLTPDGVCHLPEGVSAKHLVATDLWKSYEQNVLIMLCCSAEKADLRRVIRQWVSDLGFCPVDADLSGGTTNHYYGRPEMGPVAQPYLCHRGIAIFDSSPVGADAGSQPEVDLAAICQLGAMQSMRKQTVAFVRSGGSTEAVPAHGPWLKVHSFDDRLALRAVIEQFLGRCGVQPGRSTQ